MRVSRLIGDSLVDHGPDLGFIPRLASGWEVLDGGTRLVFTLREGVRWQDGTPLTAEDVVATYRRATDPEVGAGLFASYFSEVEAVEATDEGTVTVRYRRPFSPALQGWERLVIQPRHPLVAEEGTPDASFQRAPIGTGPYRLLEWSPGQQLVLQANEDYWGGRPHLDRIVFRIIPDVRTAYGSLLAGEVDVARIPADEPDPGDRVQVVRSSALQVSFIAWRQDGSNPFFSEARVRRAMTLALDRQGFLQTVLGGLGQLATSTFVPGTWAFDGSLQPIPYDPEEAQRLLDEAGWRRNGDEETRSREGVPFRFSLVTFRRNQEMQQLALVLQDSLRRIGVQMEIERLEWSEFLERLHQGRFEAVLHVMSLDVDPDPFDFWHSSQIGEGMNYAAYADPDVDRWSEEGRRVFSHEERSALYHRIQQRLHRDQPFTFLFHPEYRIGVAPRLRGFRTTPAGPWYWYPANLTWWVPAALQRYPTP